MQCVLPVLLSIQRSCQADTFTRRAAFSGCAICVAISLFRLLFFSVTLQTYIEPEEKNIDTFGCFARHEKSLRSVMAALTSPVLDTSGRNK